MKRFLPIVFAGLAWIPSPLLACQNVSISTHPFIPPWSWLQGDRLDGVGIEITRDVLDRLKIPYQVTYLGSWKRVLKLAETGHLDIVPNVFKTPERQEWLIYQNSPFKADDAVVFSRRDTPFPITSLKDLAGLRGGTTVGDSWGAEFDRFLNKQGAERAPTAQSLMKMLAHHRIDYAVYAVTSGRAVAKSIGLSEQIQHHPAPRASEGMYIGFSKKSSCAGIAPAFEQALEAYLREARQAGQMDRLIERKIEAWAQSVQETN
ncbi:substrate-binding periplasmic protein [Aestuariispira insulae]|uniref:Amino acid ABC transporter substrate-binding protein (PAAT family) n=1 Tax=Aestuariispira insulae TaxID=1461337 RepID=A0A3D9HK96_9PROT|nr:transporter substrate-binding domain-containing protein [Aestuariispira insulae]RED49919.1 amino acid ABC transporter substrate-binding protein (PAAT family) [Aestuariispira insulae]